MSEPELEHGVVRQQLMEGISVDLELERDIEGGTEKVNVYIEDVRAADDGRLVGTITAVDEYALDGAIVVTELPEEIDLEIGKPLVLAEGADEEERKKRKFVTPAIAAVVGAAALVGGTALYIHRKRQ